MRLKNVMKTRLNTLSPDATVGEAREFMRRHGTRHILVAKGTHLLGVVSDRDLGFLPDEIPPHADNTALAVAMSAPPATLPSDATLKDAANMMRSNKFGAVPVVDHGKLVGIVTESDALEALAHLGTTSHERASVWGRGHKMQRQPAPLPEKKSRLRRAAKRTHK